MLLHEKPVVLVVGGHDPSGGAGITADVRAIEACGGVSQSIITAMTMQSHTKYDNTVWIGREAIAQLKVLLPEVHFSAIKVGLVPSLEFLKTLFQMVEKTQGKLPPVVWDPVLASSTGGSFHTSWSDTYLRPLLAQTALWTPNLMEAQKLGGKDWEIFLKEIAFLSPTLLKGGHGEEEQIIDRLYKGKEETEWVSSRLEGSTRGTGCVLASCIAVELAKGTALKEAIQVGREKIRTYWTSSKTVMGVWNYE